MSLRILHVLDHSIPLHSGYTFRTLSILREQRARGWDTFHVTSPKHHVANTLEEEVDGWHFFRTLMHAHPLSRIPAASEMRLMSLTTQRIQDVSRRVSPDVIHAHSPALNAIPALRAGRALGIPVVYEVRAFWEDAAVDHGTSQEWGLRYRLTRSLETYALKRANHVFTICEGLRTEILRRGIPEQEVTVIPNAVDTTAFRFRSPPDEALRKDLGLEGKSVIGFIGSFYAYEGLDLLLRALPRVLGRLPHTRVLLVGGGPQEASLKSLAGTLGISDKVIFVGRVPHSEVQRYYSLVDLVAYPRYSMRLTELVTPLKPLEAMAQGHLVVASDVGGHRELIQDGETGILFRAGDQEALAEAIIRVSQQPDSWPRLRQQGRAFVENERTWRNSVSRYAPVYERLRARVAS